MISITTSYKEKKYIHNYEGEINIYIDEDFVRIDWFIDEQPPINENELDTWRSNGFDCFEKKYITSIVGL
jgi:hypothetical protein